MKFGIYPGGRAGTVCSHPPDVAAIRHLVDDIAGGRPFVVREYVHFFGDATPPDVVTSLGAEHELAHLTMPDGWYVEGNRELDLVLSYLPRAADLSGWLAFLDTVIDRYGHLTRYLQVTLEPNFPIPLIDGSAPGVLEALTLRHPARPHRTGPAGSPARADRLLRRRTTGMVGRRRPVLVVPVLGAIPGLRGPRRLRRPGPVPRRLLARRAAGQPGRYRIPHHPRPAPLAGLGRCPARTSRPPLPSTSSRTAPRAGHLAPSRHSATHYRTCSASSSPNRSL